jgi:hypothetical protein
METLYRYLMFLMVLTTGSLQAEYAGASDLYSASDVQHFEQAYEDWTAQLVRGLDSKLKFTVVTQVQFSQNPEKLEAFEDARASNHLPGLPDVADPIYSNPTDSPLYALAEKKNIKIYFQSPITANEERVIREIINLKLKLSNNDSLQIEHTDAPAPSPKGTPFSKRRALALASFLAGAILLFGALFNQKLKLKKWSIFKKASPKKVVAATPLAISPSVQIMNAKAVNLREAVAEEKVEVIAKASLNATRDFSNQVLGEMSQEKFDLVNQWIERNKKKVSAKDSNYSRLLLAARLQQINNRLVLKSIESYGELRAMRKKITEFREVSP